MRGLVVSPGLIDLHVHLREPGQSGKETIATGTAAAARGSNLSFVSQLDSKAAPSRNAWHLISLVREISLNSVGIGGRFVEHPQPKLREVTLAQSQELQICPKAVHSPTFALKKRMAPNLPGRGG